MPAMRHVGRSADPFLWHDPVVLVDSTFDPLIANSKISGMFKFLPSHADLTAVIWGFKE
jgi:hypothetical protein